MECLIKRRGIDTSDGNLDPNKMLVGQKGYSQNGLVEGVIPIVTPTNGSSREASEIVTDNYFVYMKHNLAYKYPDGVDWTCFSTPQIRTALTSDANLSPEQMLEGASGYDDGVLKQGAIKSISADYNGQLPAHDIITGAYSGDGQQYLYMSRLDLDGKYNKGATWLRKPVADALNALGAKEYKTGVVNAPSTEYFTTSVYRSLDLTGDNITYTNMGGYGSYVSIPTITSMPKIFIVIDYVNHITLFGIRLNTSVSISMGYQRYNNSNFDGNIEPERLLDVDASVDVNMGYLRFRMVRHISTTNNVTWHAWW